MFFRCVVYLSVTALSHTKVVLSYGLLRIYRSFGPWYVFLYIGAQNPTGYPPTKGSGFWSQGNNKYQMMPKTASNPKPVGFWSLGTTTTTTTHYPLRGCSSEKNCFWVEIQNLLFHTTTSLDGTRPTRIKKMEYKCV